MALVFLALIMGAYFHWNIVEIAILVIFVWTILHPIDSRYLAFLAFFSLILTPLFLVLKKPILAEKASIYAYFFLILAVVMSIYELRKEKSAKGKI